MGEDISFASLTGFRSLVGANKSSGRVEWIGLTDSHEFFHLFSLHALLEFALFRGAEAETRKTVSTCRS
jgi:hypothetical protein